MGGNEVLNVRAWACYDEFRAMGLARMEFVC